MKKMLLLVTVSLLITMSTGCAWSKQHVQLNPQLDGVSSNFGQGEKVGVKVTDERTERILGHRSVGAVGAEMTIDDHPEEVIKERICESLKSNGFTPVEYNPSLDRSLKVELREIKFYISMGFWTGGVHTNVALKAIAKNNGNEHEQFYRE
ncbi:MAG: YajG family lipoprotein, partial [Planctomycetota bacterium]